MKICFSGAHRTGKTSLAERVALENDLIMYYTEVGKTFKDRSVKELENLRGREGFYERIKQQEEIYNHLVKKISDGEDYSVFDRSVFDVYVYSEFFLGKLLKEFKVEQKDIQSFNSHLKTIRQHLNMVDFIFILQPKILFEDKESSCSFSIQEPLNEAFLDIAKFYLPEDKYFVIPKEVVDLEERVKICNSVIRERFGL